MQTCVSRGELNELPMDVQLVIVTGKSNQELVEDAVLIVAKVFKAAFPIYEAAIAEVLELLSRATKDVFEPTFETIVLDNVFNAGHELVHRGEGVRRCQEIPPAPYCAIAACVPAVGIAVIVDCRAKVRHGVE